MLVWDHNCMFVSIMSFYKHDFFLEFTHFDKVQGLFIVAIINFLSFAQGQVVSTMIKTRFFLDLLG